jgi:hypothetical protein
VSSEQSTYSEIIATLDKLGAPPGATIAERIRFLYREAIEAGARVIVEERERAAYAIERARRSAK